MRPRLLLIPDRDDRSRQERQMTARMGRAPIDLGLPAIGTLAEQQGGCVARWQLRWLALPATTIARLVSREGWTALHAGVWLLPGAALDDWARLWAAVLALSAQDGGQRADELLTPDADPVTVAHIVAADRVVATGLTAAWLRRLVSTPPRRPQLLLDGRHHPDREGMTLVRTELDRFEGVVRIGELAVAGGPRMAWDIAWLTRRHPGGVQDLVDVVITADRKRVMAVDDLIAVVDEPCQFALPMRVPKALRMAAEALRPGFSHSRTEALGRRIAGEVAAELGLEVHPRPYAIRRDGRIIAEADIAVLSLRHDLEVDGPHHDLLAQKGRNRKRDAGLGGIDWAVTRYPVGLIDADQAGYAGRVRSDLQMRTDEAA